MNNSLLLLGVGGAGARAVKSIERAYGAPIRTHIVDTDAASGEGPSFTLLGGSRLAGHGAGGDVANARAAYLDDPSVLDPVFTGVRTVVVVVATGGGTGAGVTAEILKRIQHAGIASFVFAIQPFGIEGNERRLASNAAASALANVANALVTLPLDTLATCAATDNFAEALAHALDTLAVGVTFFWRLLEKPGYIAFGEERLRTLLATNSTVRFLTASASGESRADCVLDDLIKSPLATLDNKTMPVNHIFCGILAGDDLRLSELAAFSKGIRALYPPSATFDLGTVNDEHTFSGRFVAVVLLFSESVNASVRKAGHSSVRPTETAAFAAVEWFRGTEKTYFDNEDADIPTYLRQKLPLEC